MGAIAFLSAVGLGAGAIALTLFHFKEVIMASIAELRTAAESLRAAVELEHQEVTEALDELRAEIAQLTELVTNGGTLEERQELLSHMVETEAKIAAIVDRPIPELPEEDEEEEEED